MASQSIDHKSMASHSIDHKIMSSHLKMCHPDKENMAENSHHPKKEIISDSLALEREKIENSLKIILADMKSVRSNKKNPVAPPINKVIHKSEKYTRECNKNVQIYEIYSDHQKTNFADHTYKGDGHPDDENNINILSKDVDNLKTKVGSTTVDAVDPEQMDDSGVSLSNDFDDVPSTSSDWVDVSVDFLSMEAPTSSPPVTVPTSSPPPVTLSSVAPPPITVPSVSVSSVAPPPVAVPSESVSSIAVRSVALSSVAVSSAAPSPVAVPSECVSSITVPSVALPSVAPPAVAVPSVDYAFVAVPSAALSFVAVPSAAPSFVAVSSAAPSFVAVPSAAPSFVAVPSVAPVFVVVPAVAPPFVPVPSVAPQVSIPSVSPTPVAVPSVSSQVAVPSASPTPVAIPSVSSPQVAVPSVPAPPIAELSLASPVASPSSSPPLPESSSSPISDCTYLCAPEYSPDIYKHLRQLETNHGLAWNFMVRQPDITHNMRSILIDWLVEVASEYKLLPETLHLTISYLDRFLSVMAVHRSKLQLVGITAMLVACKVEEVYPPNIKQFIFISDDSYTKRQIFIMEKLLLKVLEFDLCLPTSHLFVNTFCNMFHLEGKCVFLAEYLNELAVLDGERFLRFSPSTLAASCVALARHTLGDRPWTDYMALMSGYSLEDLTECLIKLFQAFREAHMFPQQAVRDKYKTDKFYGVAYLSSKLAHLSMDQIFSC